MSDKCTKTETLDLNNEILGALLEDAKSRGIKIRDLAKQTGVNYNSLYKLVNGENFHPSVDIVNRFLWMVTRWYARQVGQMAPSLQLTKSRETLFGRARALLIQLNTRPSSKRKSITSRNTFSSPCPAWWRSPQIIPPKITTWMLTRVI